MSYQQQPIRKSREDFELELRDLLTKDLPAGADGYPSASTLRKADDLIMKVLLLADRFASWS